MDNDLASVDSEFEKYLDKVQHNLVTKSGKPKSLSAVKILILRTLWDSGELFPRNWVTSQILNDLTNQKYFDRRVRELRDQNGCDIETGIHEGSHAYRLCSDTVTASLDRTYLTDKQRVKLFDEYDFSCASCGLKFSAENYSGLQADHKVPLIRGGGADITNWQPLCVSCNVAKRRSCQGCDVDCKVCAWAYPEQFGQTFSIQLQGEVGSKLQNVARKRSKTPHSIIIEAIQKFLDDELSDGEL